MIPINKIRYRITAYWFSLLLVIVLLGNYGREAIDWMLTKLYEVFILSYPAGN